MPRDSPHFVDYKCVIETVLGDWQLYVVFGNRVVRAVDRIFQLRYELVCYRHQRRRFPTALLSYLFIRLVNNVAWLSGSVLCHVIIFSLLFQLCKYGRFLFLSLLRRASPHSPSNLPTCSSNQLRSPAHSPVFLRFFTASNLLPARWQFQIPAESGIRGSLALNGIFESLPLIASIIMHGRARKCSLQVQLPFMARLLTCGMFLFQISSPRSSNLQASKMTTPKGAPSPSFAPEDLDGHQEKRPRVEDQTSFVVVDSEVVQATALDEAIASVSEAPTTLAPAPPSATPQEALPSPAAPLREASPSDADASTLSPNTPPSNVQATFEDESDELASIPRRGGRSPLPSGDVRILLWRDENSCLLRRDHHHREEEWEGGKDCPGGTKSPLMVSGRPQFNLFVDGSYRSLHKPREEEERDTFSRGDYGVVFRNPYHSRGDDEFDHGQNGEAWDNNSNTPLELNVPEDALGRREFNIRSWISHRVYSSRHAELAAISQGLETAIAVAKRQNPSSGVSVTIFSDSKDVINRIARPPISADMEMTDGDAMSMPLVRVIVWQSHYLADEWNCEIKLRWLPRCCVLAHKLADYVAEWWRGPDKLESGDGTAIVFQQKDRPVWHRDGILDTLHQDLERCRQNREGRD